jgi:signal transduction histidine kinase
MAAMTSLRHRLWLGYGGLLLILLAVSILTVIVLTNYSHVLQRIFHENYDSVVYCDNMKSAMEQLNLRQQLVIWRGPSAAQIDQAAQQKIFHDNLADELNNCTLRGELEHSQRLSDLWQQYSSAAAQFDAAPAPRQLDLYRATLLPLFQQIKATAQWIADANMSNMVSVDGQVKRTLIDVRNALLVLVIAGTLAAAVVVGTTATSILHRVGDLTRSARQIEAGNLDPSLAIRTNDEIGELAGAFNSMAATLREYRRIDHQLLALAQQTTQLAIDSLPDAVFIIGPAGEVEISNRAAVKYFGIDPGLSVEQLAPRLKWLPPLYDSVKDGQKPAEPQGYRSAIQLFDAGEERFLLPRAVPMVAVDKTIGGVCIILVDVTRLRAVDEAKSRVVSTVSHELRTPLTSIRMALDLLFGLRFGPLTPKQNTLLGAAREDSDRLHRIIENLLNIGRIESGRAEFQFRAMTAAEVIAQALDPLRDAFAEKSLSLDVRVDPQLPRVLADPASIGSAFTNLLSNALKFTPAGGRVSVAAETDDDMVRFTVADTGPGIPEQYAARVFDKFFRVPTPLGPSGAGLGLAIAKEIVEAHGGVIMLCRDNGPGSTFRFTLRQCGRTA